MALEFQDAMIVFLAKMVKQMDKLQEDSRLSTAIINCLNAFLLKNGLDVFSKVSKLYSSKLAPFKQRKRAPFKQAHIETCRSTTGKKH